MRRHLESIPPGVLARSTELRLLLAWLDSWHDDGFHEDQFRSAIAREEARAEGRLSPAARYIGDDADPELLEAFTLSGGEGVKRILGYIDGESFHPGLAGLTYQETQVMHKVVEGFTAADTQRQINRRWQRGKGVSVRTVEDHVYNAKAKLKRLLREEQDA